MGPTYPLASHGLLIERNGQTASKWLDLRLAEGGAFYVLSHYAAVERLACLTSRKP